MERGWVDDMKYALTDDKSKYGLCARFCRTEYIKSAWCLTTASCTFCFEEK